LPHRSPMTISGHELHTGLDILEEAIETVALRPAE
jgi:4-aminobutyrate aminotransferase-like enzyme